MKLLNSFISQSSVGHACHVKNFVTVYVFVPSLPVGTCTKLTY